ncbi:MAG: tRNA (N(6)-L-threonylcarbamoyladenosine(37)-C(2))-methylthiotransferase MtaB [Dissulfurispiraceae bacterium]|jgi:threonylcarbamoyladenosine tRNA methylthiotransferase MtaB|nr:tRNA (N(6)-L-threonylcarbamoyladenosine(37)-C(2))-methylthiotransferase MtaB [Dissulfurispiraceae bacterium]
MRVAILTLGCRTNQAESFHLEQKLLTAGHQIVRLSEAPDYCIINTCTVTAKADHQSEQMIRTALSKVKSVITTGCFSQLHITELKNKYPSLQIIENTDKNNILNVIDSDISCKTLNFKGLSRHRPSLKVQDGCNFSCTYCTIPLARGLSRSRGLEDVVNDVLSLEQAGYHEVVLCGIHLGLYGKDLLPELSIDKLLKVMLERTRTIRFRLSSIEINEVSDDLINLLNHQRVCQHLHLPLQSGDDEILSCMNRNYSVAEFVGRLKKISIKVPRISIGTDIIVGFPGETDQSFNKTKELLQSLPIAYLHAFPYSRRPNTAALKFNGHVEDQIKSSRAEQLRNISHDKKYAFARANFNETLAVVTEAATGETISGTTDNYIKVLLKATNGLMPGMLVKARIADINENRIAAYVIN